MLAIGIADFIDSARRFKQEASNTDPVTKLKNTFTSGGPRL
jgi:hypothetical protein